MTNKTCERVDSSRAELPDSQARSNIYAGLSDKPRDLWRILSSRCDGRAAPASLPLVANSPGRNNAAWKGVARQFQQGTRMPPGRASCSWPSRPTNTRNPRFVPQAQNGSAELRSWGRMQDLDDFCRDFFVGVIGIAPIGVSFEAAHHSFVGFVEDRAEEPF